MWARGRGGGGWLMAVALGLGCRAPEPVEPVEPTPAARGVAVTSGPERARATPATEADEERPPSVVEPAAELEPQAWVDVELPFPPEAVVLRPVLDIAPVVLFPDEADAIRREVAKALEAHGIPLVPVEELERIEAAAAQGRLVLEGDQACRAPLLPAELVARYFAKRRYVEIEAGCIDECRVHASLQDPNDSEVYEGFGSPEVARVHDPKAWVAVAGRLRGNQGWGGIGFGMTGMSHPPPIRFDFPQGVGPWARPVEELSFSEAEVAAAACAHPDPLVGFTYEVRASVDRGGQQVRCEAWVDHSMARPSDAACVCEALRALDLPKGPAGRRLRVQAVDAGGFRGSRSRFELVQPGTEPWVRRFDESPMLARCLQSHSLPKGIDAMLRVDLAPDGTANEVRLDGDITTRETMQFASCVVQEARTVALPCRPPGIERLEVRLVIESP